jgi:CO/xanthine dehydrogenase FAD-binding subunit
MMDLIDNSSRSLIASSDGDRMRVAGSALLVHIAQALATSPYPLLAAACEHEPAMADAQITLSDCLGRITACVRTADSMWCAISGSDACAARAPGRALHSIIDGGPCRRANPSAVAVAMVALEAEFEVAGPNVTRAMPAEEFFALTDSNVASGLPSDLRVVTATLPSVAAGGFQRLFTGAGADSGASPISLAAVRRVDGDVRLVLGGVSPRPYRVYTSVEEEAMAGGLDEDAIAGLAERALLDAEAERESADTFDAAAALLRRAIAEIAAISP